MTRVDPDLRADERTTILQFLDYHRATMEEKASGLDAVSLRATLPPSDLSLGALVKHLALVEDNWFQAVLLGRPLPEPWLSAPFDDDPDWQMHSAAADDPADLLALYREACDRSRYGGDQVVALIWSSLRPRRPRSGFRHRSRRLRSRRTRRSRRRRRRGGDPRSCDPTTRRRRRPRAAPLERRRRRADRWGVARPRFEERWVVHPNPWGHRPIVAMRKCPGRRSRSRGRTASQRSVVGARSAGFVGFSVDSGGGRRLRYELVFDHAALLELIPPADRLIAAGVLLDAAIDVDPAELNDVAMTERLLACIELTDRARALTMITAGAWEPRQSWCGSNARTARAWLAHHGDLGATEAGRLLRAGRS